MWAPPGHWRLLGFCLVAVLVVLAFQGFATHTIGASSEPAGARGSAAPLSNSRPILVARKSRLVSIQPPPGRRIALTFDDGPDSRWTTRIADELRTAGVRATFFVIGSQAARYPGIVRRLVSEGKKLEKG